MALPDTLHEVDAIVTDVAHGLGIEVERRTPLTEDDVQTVLAAVEPDVLPAELEEVLRFGCVWPWNDPRPIVPDLLSEKYIYEAEEFGAAHWLPIGGQQRDHWSAVLGPSRLPRTPLVVWSSNALVSAAPFPSIRTFLLGWAEALSVMADLEGDDLRLMQSDWWQAATGDRRHANDLTPCWQRYEGPLRDLIAAEDESPLWPPNTSPMPFTQHIDLAAWDERWRTALRVVPYRRHQH